jgi:hypothetical protein
MPRPLSVKSLGQADCNTLLPLLADELSALDG